MNNKPCRRWPLCAVLGLAGAAAAQPQRVPSQFGAASQLGAPAATPASNRSSNATPSWTLPASTTQTSAATAGTPAPQAPPATATAASRRTVFEMADATPIVVHGQATTAGALKKTIRAELVVKAGAAKSIPGGTRVQTADTHGDAVRRPVVATQSTRDLPTTNVPPGTGFGAAAGNSNAVGGILGPLPPLHKRPTLTPPTTATAQSSDALLHRTSRTAAGPIYNVSETRCLDKGPPVISEVAGWLKPGGKATVWGKCFGERSGHVEVIGQFPGGKLDVAFTGWDQTDVVIEVPATVRGATDHTVALTVVTADGKRSPAVQAKFVAARERVEVPDRLWSPASAFDLAATTESNSGKANLAASGHLARSLRINPQCGLDTMETMVLSGTVNAVHGWDQGPPNEAAVTIDWSGTCLDTTTTTQFNYVIGQSYEVLVSSACRVALQPRAWAYCPAGVAP